MPLDDTPQSPSIDVAGFRIEWDLDKGVNLWAGIPTLSMWLPTTTAGLMAGMQGYVFASAGAASPPRPPPRMSMPSDERF